MHDPVGNRQYTIKNIWEMHREIVRLAVTGMKYVDIARTIGVSPTTVSVALNSPPIKRELMQLSNARDVAAVDIAKRIQEAAPRALEVLEELLEDGNDAIKLKAATDLLDRAGHSAVKKLQTVSTYLDKNDLEDIKNRAKSAGLLVDEPIQALEA